MQSSGKRRVRSLQATGVLSATVLLSSVCLAPAVAAPAGDVPSAAEVAAALESTAATTALVTEIEDTLAAATADLQDAQTTAMESQGAYVDALAVLEERRATAVATTALADEAAAGHEAATAEVGQLAGDLYRSGGVTPGMTMLLSSDDPDELMYRASTMYGLSANRATTFTNARTAANTWDALRTDASAAREAAADAADAARSAGEANQRATAAAERLVAERESERAILVEQLASLRDTTAALEERRISGLEAQQRERDLARIIAESERAAAAELAAEESIEAQPAAPAAIVPPTPAAEEPAPSTPAPNRRPVPTPPVQAPEPTPEPSHTPVPRPPAPAPSPPAPEPTPAPAPPAPAPPAPAPPPSDGGAVSAAISYAMSKTGSPHFYQWGGTGPLGFDCSGLVQQAFASGGISLPRVATAQYAATSNHVPLAQAQPGDLVFWGTPGNFYHVGIYVGNNRVVNALNESQGILVTDLAHMGGMPNLYPLVARF
ncbi:NlpC/P60 family protein [Arthrobacter sp. 260]|uniref:C40 family peptidase n=1 Tax=Arthrobacter sp. 260 TaxID=2735314 RepID=UPI0032087420